ncbi:MAG: hypothetical protein R3C26_01875 [Calditrichia bacterium]
MNLDTTGFVSVNVGKYNPLLGKSYAEIAALSRSMHKCQGFGASPQRGGYREYFQHTLGDPATASLFDGVELSWKRVPRGEKVGKLLAEALENFQPQQPTAIIPTLLKARSEMSLLRKPTMSPSNATNWTNCCCNFAASGRAPPCHRHRQRRSSSSVAISTTLINRNGYPVTLRGISYPFENGMPRQPALARQRTGDIRKNHCDSGGCATVQSYWLRSEKQGSLFTIPQPLDIGLPEKFAVQPVRFSGDRRAEVIAIAPVYKWNDETDGESYRSMEILPQVTVNFGAGLQVFGNGESRQVR